MAKRTAVDEVEYEEDEEAMSTPAKRRRTNVDNHSKRDNKLEAKPADDEDEDADEDSENKFEAEYADAVRASIAAKSRLQGKIAQHGIIQSLEMHQFMCHKRLSFTFGPQVNFIIGHNGSGKSAVLSAITVALGGKATSTGRGSGLKSFIREGQSVSEVSIVLKNEGEEAYKPDIYGKSITITRRFTKDGSSSYKIKGKDGKVVSNKREELSAICDHMNIQVDNPMNILTQDAARQFLSASQPGDKYKFFLKGTQLSQLSEEYETCLENIGKTAKVLEQKKDALPELKKQVKEAEKRYADAHKALAQKAKADDLKKELAWAHVRSKEEEMTAKYEEEAKANRRLPKIQDPLEKAQAAFVEFSETIVSLEDDMAQLGDIDHLTNRKKEVQDQLRTNKSKLADMITTERNMNTELERIKKRINDFQTHIAIEQAKQQEDQQSNREAHQKKLDDAKRNVEEHEIRLRELNGQIREKEELRRKLADDGRVATNELQKAKDKIMNCATQFDRCKEQMKNKLLPYGKDLNTVLARIKQTRWHGETPKGPLGAFVSLRDSKWAPVMRAQLGGMMTSFTVTDVRDRAALKKILSDTGNAGAQIIVSEVDLFDYSDGEPAQDMITVLRALDINDPYILRVLINQVQIEKIFLAETRKVAQDITSCQRGGGVAWSNDGMVVRSFGDGGGQSTRIQTPRQGDVRELMFTQGDPAVQMRHWQEQGRAADEELKVGEVKAADLAHQVKVCVSELQTLQNQGRRLHATVMEFKRIHAQVVEEYNEVQSVDLRVLQAQIDDCERQKTSIMAQFTDVETRKVAVNVQQQPLMHEMERLKHQINSFEEQRQFIQRQVEDAAAARMKAQSDKNHYEKKLAEETAKVALLTATAQALEQEYKEWTAKAELYCARYPDPRLPDEVNRDLKSVQRALADREKEQGATVEDLQLALIQSKANLEAAEKDLRDMISLNRILKQALLVRLARWNDFRRHIALRTKLQFQYHLSNRGYFGKVLFDHTNETLQLKVQTDDQMSTQSKDKDPRSLSGGEKSFATICLLLSLWEAIGCPIRCLDEFDVFMDAVNRRISMKMMIETANSSDSKQYILITPQDMSTVQLGPTVRVNRMVDPERGQTTLT